MDRSSQQWIVSVRELVEFSLRRGDLSGDGRFSGPARALEGTRGHQEVQGSRPEGYETQVSVKLELEGEVCRLRVQGRIDGVFLTEDGAIIEEIKTIAGHWTGEANPLHWAQARIYGHMFLHQHGELDGCRVQLSYLELHSGEVTELREEHSRAELAAYFDSIVSPYLDWLDDQERWRTTRNLSISELAFPFDQYRPGQRAMAVAVYRRMLEPGRLFVEAPTGIGKTISTCFPAVKALREGEVDKVVYLTAKTLGRANAEQALSLLREAGLRCRSVTLTAKDKICFKEEGAERCDVSTCPYTQGYFDRVKGALIDCFAEEALTREKIEVVARRHTVCPHELSLDAAQWADVVIGDYNHAFDPSAQLKRFFSDRSDRYAVLVDEAHNLVDRAREMYSGAIGKKEVLEVKRAVQKGVPGCARTLGRVQKALLSLRDDGTAERVTASPDLPDGLVKLLRQFQREAEAWLGRDESTEFRDLLLDFYFKVTSFLRTADLFDDHFVSIIAAGPRDVRVRLYCLDPSELMRKAVKGWSVVFFSATLTPLDYYRDLLGGSDEDPSLTLTSPFPPERLGVFVGAHVGTRYKEREGSYGEVAATIGAAICGRSGNYLVYFPSHKYLKEVVERFETLHPEVEILVQAPLMSEEERGAFLERFRDDTEDTLVGFAVMGGIFGEGIDLVGDRLVGAIVVGVGLPQLCMERDLIREHFQEKNRRGFDYAYAFPGINRVLQAAGRVIRTETDRGIVVLIDDRFGEERYWRMFPANWTVQWENSSERIQAGARSFWGAIEEAEECQPS